MLNSVKSLYGYKLAGLDGELGKVKEFYFDDHFWTIRYLVADTGNWITDRSVLISPYALKGETKSGQHMSVTLTRKQIESSPSIATDQPVSLQFEDSYYRYYSWPTYWGGAYAWGPTNSIERDHEKWGEQGEAKPWDRHLRRTREVTGYHVHGADGEVGHVDDFIMDEDTWTIRYLVVETNNWWPGKKVLIAPEWVERVSWVEKEVFVKLSRERIKASPAYTGASALVRDYEAGLYAHYGRNGYWRDQRTA